MRGNGEEEEEKKEGNREKRVHEAWARNKMLCSVSRGVGEADGKIERAF